MKPTAAQQTTRSEDAPLKPLNARQQRFVAAYARHWNGTRAAIEAGYSPRSARVTACRMLTKAIVAAKIKALRSRRMSDLDEQIQALVRQYARIAFSTVCPLDYLVVLPCRKTVLRPIEEWTVEMRLMCQEVKASRTRVRVVLRSRDHALKMLTRYTGEFVH